MTVENPAKLNALHVRRNFDRAAARFRGADFLHRAAADGLMQRLQPMAIRPAYVVDLGSALGTGSKQLARHFPGARVLSVDLSAQMLLAARQSRRWFSKVRELQANASQLPLRSASVDCVFANMLMPWIDDLPGFFGEIARVLRKDGVLLFSTLGPDSLTAIRSAWQHVDEDLHVHPFADMHNLGDTMMHAGLGDPVLDVDYQTISYRSKEAIFADLAATGARNSLQCRRSTLTGKGRFGRFLASLDDAAQDGVIEVRMELVYGHAFGAGAAKVPGEFRFAPQDIGRRRN